MALVKVTKRLSDREDCDLVPSNYGWVDVPAMQKMSELMEELVIQAQTYTSKPQHKSLLALVTPKSLLCSQTVLMKCKHCILAREDDASKDTSKGKAHVPKKVKPLAEVVVPPGPGSLDDWVAATCRGLV